MRMLIPLLLIAISAGAQNTGGLQQKVTQLMADGEVPGLSIAVVRDGKISWTRALGVKSTETKQPVDANTMFDAGSLTKPVVAYAVLKLVDAGKLSLDEPLSKYVPAYIADERINRITARNVLSHTTGFPNWRGNSELKINFATGERFSYSGEGFVYLAKAVQKITGEATHDTVRRLVFEPLGMASSTMISDERLEAQAAPGHSAMGQARPLRRTAEANAAASLRTTASDYARFMIAVMTGAGLKTATARMMLSPQIQLDENCVQCASVKEPKLTKALAWGLGVGLERTKAGDGFWHWGDNGDYKCFMLAYPRGRDAVVVFTNSNHGLSIIPDIVSHVFPGEHPPFAWLKYDRYDSPVRTMAKIARDKGGEAAVAHYRALPAAQRPPERAINGLGYTLLNGLKRPPDAIAVFKLNVEMFPQSANVYDSLGEAYMTAGQKDLAAANYKKSLELDPGNNNAAEMLKKLGGQPAAAAVELDVAYGSDERQRLDVYRPEGAGQPRPAILFVHGGGWRAGSKRAFEFYARDAASRGYVAVSTNYRLAPQHRFPAAVDDVVRAVSWVREHAREYNIDPARICAVGSSAGGHLVAMLAARSLVTCAVDYFGPTDFTGMRGERAASGPLMEFLGKSAQEAPEWWAQASPVTHITARSAPVLAIHGTADTTVPVSQSEVFVERLKKVGVEASLLRVEGAPHGFHNRADTPDARNAWKAALEFLNRHLQKR